MPSSISTKAPKFVRLLTVPLQLSAGGILVVQAFPWIRLGLFHAEGDFLVLLVELEHGDIDRIADGDELGRVAHVLGPRHFRNVDETLDAFFEFDEGAVVGDADNATLGLRVLRVLVVDLLPRMGGQLTEAQ